MATFYKYAERNADSQINWAEVGRDVTDMLREEDKIREQKKAAIDEASRQYGKLLASAPTGEHTGANTWTLNYANDATQARLLQDRLLKSGQLKLKDYLIMRQNLVDGTDQVFNLAKEYQAEYADKMERFKKGESQALESFLMASVEGFANFNESKALINPTDYTVNVGKMKKGEDGVYQLTNDVASVNELRNRIKGKFDKFNTRQANEQIATGLASYINTEIKRGSLTRAGQVITIEDAMQRPGYQKAVDDAIEANLQVPYNVSSILTEDIGFDRKTGKEYDYTYDDKEAARNPNLILLKVDPVTNMATPQFTKEQKQAVKDFMKGQIEQMIKRKEEIDTFVEPRVDAATLAYSKDSKDQQDLGTMLAKSYSGNNDEVQSAITYFNNNPDKYQVNRVEGGILVTDVKEKTTKLIPFYVEKNGEMSPIGRDNFIRAASTAFGFKGNTDNLIAGARKFGKSDLNAQYITRSATVPAEEKPNALQILQQYGLLNPNIPKYDDK